MARTTSTIRVLDLASVCEDPTRGVISIMGDHGAAALVTGEVYRSNVFKAGMIAVETEHGTLYLDDEADVQVVEDDGRGLDDRVPESLYALNDVLTSHLAERYGWFAQDEDAYARLNDVVHATAALLEELMSTEVHDNEQA